MQPLSLFDAEPEASAPSTAPLRARSTPAASPLTPLELRPTGPVLLAVDGNSLAHRAYHAYPDGRYGFLALLAGVCDRAAADAVVVGFDCRERSERRLRYPAYKAGRTEKDAALNVLLDRLPALLDDLGVAMVQPDGWEADDVCGSAAATAEAAGWRCVVATSDKDAFALVSRRTTVLRLRTGLDNALDVTPAVLAREVGVRPEQYVEFAALRGDVSDNLPGVRGIGPAKAAALLRAYADVAAAAADPLGLLSVLPRGPGRMLLDDLAAEPSVFRRNVELMTVRRDLPIDLSACRPRATAAHIADRLTVEGLGALGGRVALAFAARPEPVPLPDAPY